MKQLDRLSLCMLARRGRAVKCRWLSLLVSCALVLGGLGLRDASAVANGQSFACDDVTAVWARGSGQKPAAGEAKAFFDSVQREFASKRPGTTINGYELGAGDGLSWRTRAKIDAYPAVGAGILTLIDRTRIDILLHHNARSLRHYDRYLSSVAKGTAETVGYLNYRHTNCPDEIFVIGGYSQGAHAVGDALMDLVDSTALSQIASVSLFGDPKQAIRSIRAKEDAFLGSVGGFRTA